MTDTSRVNREVYARFCRGLVVKFLRPTWLLWAISLVILHDDAKAHWAVLSKELLDLELLTNIDVGALAICCDAFSKFIKANKEIEKHGMLVTYTNKGGNKNVVPNPYVAISNKYSDVYKRYCSEFGLTPTARLRLATPKEAPKPKTDFDRKFGDV